MTSSPSPRWFRAKRPRARSPTPDARWWSRPDALTSSPGPWGGWMAQVILFNVTNGLIIGAFYVLMALGLSLILNLSNVINFAHGNFLALGGYLAYTLSPALGYWGALLVSPLLTALIGVVVERLMIRLIYNRDPVYSLLLTFGLAFVIQDIC